MVDIRKKSFWSIIKSDRFLIFFLCISVSLFSEYARFFIIPVFFKIIQTGRFGHNANTIWALLLFSLVYLLAFYTKDLITSRIHYVFFLFPPIYYMAGCYLGSKYNKNEDALLLIVSLVLVSYSAYHFYNISQSIITNNGSVIIGRMILDSSGRETYSATLYALVLSVLVAGITFILVPKQKGFLKWVRIIGIALSLVSIYGMATVVTRTTMVEAISLLFISVFMRFKERGAKRGMVTSVLFFVILYVVASSVLSNDMIAQISGAYQMREGESDEAIGMRLPRWISAVTDLLFNPAGTPNGRLLSHATKGYAHNMWLDIGLTTGWIPMIIMIFITVKNIRESFKLWNNRVCYGYFTRIFFFALFIVFMLGCMVEPVCEADYCHCLLYLFFCGIVSELTYNKSAHH